MCLCISKKSRIPLHVSRLYHPHESSFYIESIESSGHDMEQRLKRVLFYDMMDWITWDNVRSHSSMAAFASAAFRKRSGIFWCSSKTIFQ